MAGKLLPQAIAAKGFVDTAIGLHPPAIAAANGYLAAAAGTVTALGNAVTQVGLIQTALIPSGAIAPPSKIGVYITGSIIAQIVTVNATIAATTAQSVAAAGVPSPTFPSSAALVNTQLKAKSSAIKLGLIIPQQI